MHIVTTATTEEFVRTAVQWIAGAIHHAAKDERRALIGLSGGSTPSPVYTMLATQQSVPWERTTLFLLDERYVSPTDKDSNTAMITKTLMTRSASAATLVAPDTSLPLENCITAYATEIDGLGRPDLVILGMGPDGHVASLFPPLAPETFGPASVLHTETDRFSVRDRISVTLPVLESAASRVFLITGNEKRALLTKMQDETQDASLCPASAFLDDRTTWIVGP